MEDITLGSKIRNTRLQSGISQEALAEMSQLNLRTIQRIENGVTIARGDSLQRIAKALNLDIKELTIATTSTTEKTQRLQNDPWVIRLMYISPFAFLIHPVLGPISPLVLWIAFRNKISGANKIGKQLIVMQLFWCLILFILYTYIGAMKFFHINLPSPDNPKSLILIIAALYIANFIYCAINLIISFKSNAVEAIDI